MSQSLGIGHLAYPGIKCYICVVIRDKPLISLAGLEQPWVLQAITATASSEPEASLYSMVASESVVLATRFQIVRLSR